MKIKKFIDFVNEMFNSKNTVPFEFDKKFEEENKKNPQEIDTIYQYKLKIKDTPYIVRFVDVSSAKFFGYNLMFTVDDGKYDDIVITNKNHMVLLFPTIKNIVVDFVNNHKPSLIYYIGSEERRKNVYEYFTQSVDKNEIPFLSSLKTSDNGVKLFFKYK